MVSCCKKKKNYIFLFSNLISISIYNLIKMTTPVRTLSSSLLTSESLPSLGPHLTSMILFLLPNFSRSFQVKRVSRVPPFQLLSLFIHINVDFISFQCALYTVSICKIYVQSKYTYSFISTCNIFYFRQIYRTFNLIINVGLPLCII